MNNSNGYLKAFHGRDRSKRVKKYYSVGNARDCIGDLSPGCEIFGVTQGQFSLFDMLEYILDLTGPADVLISTWTAAGADTKRAREFLDNGFIRSIRWLVDRSFATRQPEYCEILVNLFGDCLRTARLHSKFITIINEKMAFAIRTSMNLNANPRIESFEISEDRELVEFMNRIGDQIFQELPEELNFKSARRQLRELRGFDDPEIEPIPGITDLVLLDSLGVMESTVEAPALDENKLLTR